MKYLKHIDFNLSNFTFKAKVSFQQNCANLLRLPIENLHFTNLNQTLNIEEGFELYLNNCIKVIFEKVRLTSKPNIINSDILLNNTAQKALQKYLDKTYPIGTFRTKAVTNDIANVYIEYPEIIKDRTLESLFLEVISRYILGQSLPSWASINGTSLYPDYQATYGFSFTRNIDNFLGYNNPYLLKEITINISGAKLKTYENSPVLITNDSVTNPNPFQQDISNISKKIKLKFN
jgi:hypothetical protein